MRYVWKVEDQSDANLSARGKFISILHQLGLYPYPYGTQLQRNYARRTIVVNVSNDLDPCWDPGTSNET